MIYIGGDHRGWNLKNKLKEWLHEDGIDFVDLGNNEYDKDDDYPLIAFKVAETVVRENGKGILLCGSGVGVAIAANKVKGIRAGICTSEKQVVAARNDDDINVLCLNTDMISEEDNYKIYKLFINTLFGSEERYIRRLNQIKTYELEKR